MPRINTFLLVLMTCAMAVSSDLAQAGKAEDYLAKWEHLYYDQKVEATRWAIRNNAKVLYPKVATWLVTNANDYDNLKPSLLDSFLALLPKNPDLATELKAQFVKREGRDGPLRFEVSPNNLNGLKVAHALKNAGVLNEFPEIRLRDGKKFVDVLQSEVELDADRISDWVLTTQRRELYSTVLVDRFRREPRDPLRAHLSERTLEIVSGGSPEALPMLDALLENMLFRITDIYVPDFRYVVENSPKQVLTLHISLKDQWDLQLAKALLAKGMLTDIDVERKNGGVEMIRWLQKPKQLEEVIETTDLFADKQNRNLRYILRDENFMQNDQTRQLFRNEILRQMSQYTWSTTHGSVKT